MDDEPTGRTIDGMPWEEPRPPHLPDALSGISPWVAPFLVLAGLHVIGAWQEANAEGDLGNPRAVVLERLPLVGIALLGAALFLRHPDAHRRLPMLAFGVVLLVVASLMPSAVGLLDEVFVARSAPGDDAGFVVHGVYRAVISMVNAFGLLYLARGLDGARRWSDVVSARSLGTVLMAVAVFTAVASVLTVIEMTDPDDVLRPLNVLAMVTNLIVTLAWAYLFVVAFSGWQAGERPRAGWLLAALASGLEVGLRILTSIGVSIDISGAGGVVVVIMGLSAVAAWLLLLFAFLVGLPSTAEPAPEELEAAATADSPGATRSGSGAG